MKHIENMRKLRTTENRKPIILRNMKIEGNKQKSKEPKKVGEIFEMKTEHKREIKSKLNSSLKKKCYSYYLYDTINC